MKGSPHTKSAPRAGYAEHTPAHPLEEAIVAELIAKLSALPPDKQQEVLDFASFLEVKHRRTLKRLYGLWKHLGIFISEEEIAEARNEMWRNFPRERFFD